MVSEDVLLKSDSRPYFLSEEIHGDETHGFRGDKSSEKLWVQDPLSGLSGERRLNLDFLCHPVCQRGFKATGFGGELSV